MKAPACLARILGCAACWWIAAWLTAHPWFEPNVALRIFEVVAFSSGGTLLGLELFGEQEK